MSHTIPRRRFLKSSAALGAACVAPWRFGSRARPCPHAFAPDDLPTVRLPGTGRVLPRLGFGGFPISRLKTDDEGVRVVLRAIERGVRYFDTAPSYGNGRSERRIGQAIVESGISREELFIATKTLRRDGKGARAELEESLDRLGVEYVDAVAVHEVHDDVDSLFGESSVVRALEKARDEGLIRHIGITGHRNPMHIAAAINRYSFATALVPVNPIDKKHLSFINGLLLVAGERGVGVIAMKVYGGGSLLAEERFTPNELLRYALSQPHVAIVVPGCEAVSHVDEACEGVVGFEPLAIGEQAELERRAGEHLGKKSEWYKDEKALPDAAHEGGDGG